MIKKKRYNLSIFRKMPNQLGVMYNSFMKWLMVKDMDIQLRMEALLGTQSNTRKLRAGTTKTERCLHMIHTQIKRYGKNCIWKSFGQEIKCWERSYFQEAGEATLAGLPPCPLNPLPTPSAITMSCLLQRVPQHHSRVLSTPTL